MIAPELPWPVAIDTIGSAPRAVRIVAADGERTALAARFGLSAITALEAELTIMRDGDAIVARGRVRGSATQACVATGEPVPAIVDEPLSLRFVPAGDRPTAEIELDAAALDVIEYRRPAIDLGEAVAESFALALDPFPRAPDADTRLREAGVLREGEEMRRAFANLASLLEKKS